MILTLKVTVLSLITTLAVLPETLLLFLSLSLSSALHVADITFHILFQEAQTLLEQTLKFSILY